MQNNLESFASHEAEYRLRERGLSEEDYNEYIDIARNALANYLLYNESAINYDGMDAILDHILGGAR